MDNKFEKTIKDLKLGIVDKDFEDDIFEVVKIEPSIKQKLIDYIRTNNIKPLNMYNRSEAIKIFQQFIKYYIDTISEYDFCEKGDETTYSIY